MKYKDLLSESMIGSEQNVRDMIQTIIMSYSAQGITDIPTEKIAAILKGRMKVDVPYNTILDIINTMPIVGDTSTDSVQMKPDGDTSAEGESSEEKVAKMATNGAKARKDF